LSERIKELAEQNGFIHNWQPPGEQYEKLQTLEKFAELIVHQMLDITDAHTEVFQTDRDRALIEHIKQSVKQHFGVE
jgi:hypothetical protein